MPRIVDARFSSVLAAMVCFTFTLPLGAQTVPAVLPAPDDTIGDSSRPVQVYILAGQSNMVGMGNVSGAKNRYAGVFLTPDPAAPAGPLPIYPVGIYRIRPLDIRAPSAESSGAIASVYAGAFDPSADYDTLPPMRTKAVALGVADGALPRVDGPHTVVVRGTLEVPESGTYTTHPGFGTSRHNVTWLNGQEVYRKEFDGPALTHAVALEAGRRHPFRTIYFNGGSTAFWLSEENLQGKGDLEGVVKRNGKFPNLLDEHGNWTVRRDVQYQEARLGFSGSPLSPTSNGKAIGPELGFGHVVGTFHDEQVLLIKTAQGNRALGFDFRPPSSGRNAPDNEWESKEYALMIEGVRKSLDQIADIVPGYAGQGYEVAGFVWWQGHKDGGSAELVAEYEQNLAHLIQDVRAEFGVPDLPAVVATVGFGGHAMSDEYEAILRAQMAVGDPALHPEFAGTVASVDTRDFWREVDESPMDQSYHYHRNAETYLLVGDALGRAMVKLRGGQAEPLPQAPRPPAVHTPAVTTDSALAKAALAPILLDGVAQRFIAEPSNHSALLAEARGTRPPRPNQFLRSTTDRLRTIYAAAGVDEYEWRLFGPDLRQQEWECFSFTPTESRPLDQGARYREVSWPDGMQDWRMPEFNSEQAGWSRGLPPFGQLDGALAPLSTSCTAPFCGCGVTPRTLWEHEVLLLRGTFEFPPLQDDHAYRFVVGGAAHVNAGEGFALHVNGRLVAESATGVAKRQGGQPRGGHLFADLREVFQDGEVTLALHSFLRYHHPRHGVQPPRGHITVWMEAAKIPPVGASVR